MAKKYAEWVTVPDVAEDGLYVRLRAEDGTTIEGLVRWRDIAKRLGKLHAWGSLEDGLNVRRWRDL